ncbi:hypothetical protein D3C76_1052790 [compost metagenome]
MPGWVKVTVEVTTLLSTTLGTKLVSNALILASTSVEADWAIAGLNPVDVTSIMPMQANRTAFEKNALPIPIRIQTSSCK